MARKKSLLRSPAFLIPTILLLILIVIFVFFILYNQSEVEKRLAAIRAAGHPANCTELDAWYPDVPFDQNAAELVLEAATHFVEWREKSILPDQCETYHLSYIDSKAYVDFLPPNSLPPAEWNIKNKSLLPIFGQAELPECPNRLSTKSLALIEDFLTDNAKALQLLHQATTLSRARYPIDLSQGFNVLLPSLGDIRHGARLLTLQAHTHLGKKQTDQALQALLAIFSTADTLKDEPILISCLVKIACESLAYDTIEHLLNHTGLNSQQLSTLQSDLADIDNKTTLNRAFIGERCLGQEIFTNPGGAAAGITPVAFNAMRITGLLEIQNITYLDLLTDFIQAAQLEYPDNYHKALELEAQIDALPFYQFIVRNFAPAFSRVFIIHTRSHTRILLVRTALAIEQFRLTHNRLPDALDELVPDFLTEVPRDPFAPDSQPLRYRRNDNGYTLYSIGEDQTDNNATTYDDQDAKYTDGTDITFTLYH